MAYGVPNPQSFPTHPYPTRYHGGIWTRPVFGMPYMRSVQSVFKPDDFNCGNPALCKGLGDLMFQLSNGVFGTERDGGGVFGPLAGPMGADCTLSPECQAAQSNPNMNTSLLDNYCGADDNYRAQVDAICRGVAASPGAPAAAPTAAQQMSFDAATVQNLQTTLNAALKPAGYTPLTVDGKIGPGTCGAIQWYRAQTGNPTAGSSFDALCATKKPWSAPTRSAAPMPASASTKPVSYNYAPAAAGMSTAVKASIAGGLLAVIGAVVAKKKGWI